MTATTAICFRMAFHARTTVQCGTRTTLTPTATVAVAQPGQSGSLSLPLHLSCICMRTFSVSVSATAIVTALLLHLPHALNNDALPLESYCTTTWVRPGDDSPYGPMGNYFCGNASAGGWVGFNDPRGNPGDPNYNGSQGLSAQLPYLLADRS